MHGIGELDELLSAIEFIKIDRFTIVNQNYMHKISPRLKLLVFKFNDQQVQFAIPHTGAVNLMDIMSQEKVKMGKKDHE